MIGNLNIIGATFIAVLALQVSGAANEEEDSGSPALVQLHRQTIPIRNSNQTVNAYFGTIEVGGTTMQKFSVVFDTGSGNVILPSVHCKSTACQVHRKYDRALSPYAEDIDADGKRVGSNQPRDQVTVEFGTGQVVGEFARDSVCLGAPASTSFFWGPTSPRYCANLHLIQAIDMSSEPFEAFAFDGVFGLGLESLSLTPEFGFLSQVTSQGAMAVPQFAVFLSNDDDDEESEIALGGFNKARLASPVSWVQVASPEQGHWQVHITSIRAGNQTLDVCNSGGCRGIVDTGTSLIAVPSDHYDQLLEVFSAKLSASQLDTDCTKIPLPDLTLELDNGDLLTLKPEDVALKSPTLNSDGTLSCQPRFMPLDLPKPFDPFLFILGEPVLHRYYVVFDRRGPRVGFGLAMRQEASAEATDLGSRGGLLGSQSPGVRGAIAARLATARRVSV